MASSAAAGGVVSSAWVGIVAAGGVVGGAWVTGVVGGRVVSGGASAAWVQAAPAIRARTSKQASVSLILTSLGY
jgi:hypothetical protein